MPAINYENQDQYFKNPIIAQNWQTGETTGQGIEAVWAKGMYQKAGEPLRRCNPSPKGSGRKGRGGVGYERK